MTWFNRSYEVNINSFGTFQSIIVTIVIIVIISAFIVQYHRSKVAMYAILLEGMIGLYLLMFIIMVNTKNLDLVFWLSRSMYLVFMAHSIVAFYTAAYINEKKWTVLKVISVVYSFVVACLILLSDQLIVTREMVVTTYVTTKKGPFLLTIFFYMFFVGVAFIFESIALYRKDREKFDVVWPIYLGVIFVSLYGNAIGITTMVNPMMKPRLFVNVLVFSFLLIIYLFKQVKKTKDDHDLAVIAYMYDDLTKTYSRNYVLSAIEDIALRHESSKTYVVMIDLDGFKNINDRYGHLYGDQLLEAFGQMLNDYSKEGWLPGRIGGDEFLIVIPGGEIESIMDKLIHLLHIYRIYTKDIRGHIDTKQVGLSIGLIEADATMSADEIVTLADETMYYAKNSGKNAIESNMNVRYKLQDEVENT